MIRTLVILLFSGIPFSGCFMYVPLGDFEDGTTLEKNVVRTSASVEQGLLYFQEERLSDSESKAWIVSSSVAYGVTRDITIGYTTWYTSFPFLSNKFTVKMNVYSSDHLSIAVMPAGIFAKTGKYGTGSGLSSQRYFGGSLSIPFSFHRGAVGMYISPRLWFGTYEQQSDIYHTVYYPDYTRIKTGDRIIRYSREYISAAAGIVFTFNRFTMIPEGILHQIDRRMFVTAGIRFGMIY